MIPSNILEKYGILESLEERLQITREIGISDDDATIDYYRSFLICTDHIPNKIIEGVATSAYYADELYYRELARKEIDKLNGGSGETSGQKPLDVRIEDAEELASIMLGTSTNKEQASEQMRRAMQMYAQTLTDEEAMEIATIYPAYEVGKAYAVNEMLTYGVNEVGDPQLYRVVQAHTSQADWTPDATPALYTPIGLNDNGYPVWNKPTGSHDAYNIGDVVDYNGTLYKSLIDGNVYSPDEYPAGWETYEEV